LPEDDFLTLKSSQSPEIKSSRRTLTQSFIGLSLLLILLVVVSSFLINLFDYDLAISSGLVPILTLGLIIFWIGAMFFFPTRGIHIIELVVTALNQLSTPKKRLGWIHLFRNKKDYAKLIAVLTIAFSLISFTLIYHATLNLNASENAHYNIGGDLKIFTDSMNEENYSKEILALPEVTTCMGFLQRTIRVGKYSISLIGVNPDEYLQISAVHSHSIVQGPSPSVIWHSLTFNPLQSIIVDAEIAEIFQWRLDSNVQTEGLSSTAEDKWNLSVKAIMRSAPGIGPLNQAPSPHNAIYKDGGWAIVHQDLLTYFGVNETNLYLLKLTTPEKKAVIIEEFESWGTVRTISTPESIKKYEQGFLQLSGVQGIFMIDLIGTLFITFFGVGMFYHYLIAKKIQDFAIYQTLGSTRPQILRLVLFEILVLILLSLGLGILTGGMFALVFLLITQGVTASPLNMFILKLTVPFPLILIIFFLLVGGILLSISFPLKRIFTIKINQLLRNL
jgi:hypothetical protein